MWCYSELISTPGKNNNMPETSQTTYFIEKRHNVSYINPLYIICHTYSFRLKLIDELKFLAKFMIELLFLYKPEQAWGEQAIVLIRQSGFSTFTAQIFTSIQKLKESWKLDARIWKPETNVPILSNEIENLITVGNQEFVWEFPGRIHINLSLLWLYGTSKKKVRIPSGT